LRAAWYVSHWLIGTGAILLGWFNIFLGLDLFFSDYPEEGTGKVGSMQYPWSSSSTSLTASYSS